MTRTLFALVLLLALRPAPAQEVSAQAGQPGTVAGVTLHAGTGAPLRKVSLALVSADGSRRAYAATSDTEGRFAFRSVRPGRYQLIGERVGFVRQHYNAGRNSLQGAIITLQPGQDLSGLVFRLTPQAVLTGRVTDEDGDPLQGVTVQVLRYRYASGRRQLTPAGAASTNDLGEYRLANLMPGGYYLCASTRRADFTPAEPAEPGAQPREEAYAPLCYPAALDISHATPLQLVAGAELQGMDLRLAKRPVVRVRGKVVDAARGTPAQNVLVTLAPRSGGLFDAFNRRMTTVRGQEGSFEIRGVLPGSYVLTLSRLQGRQGIAFRQPLEVGRSDIDGLVLGLGEPQQLRGVVRVEQGEPAGLERVRLALIPSEDGASGTYNASVKADGAFELPHVGPDKYLIRAFNLPENVYLKAARAGNTEVLEFGLDLTSGASPGPLEIVLSTASGAVAGLVSDGQGRPAPAATVTLLPESRRRHLPHLHLSVATDQNGSFLLRGVAPGDYRLFAWEDIEAGAWQDPEYLRPFENQGVAVTVRENGQESVQLRLIPAASR